MDLVLDQLNELLDCAYEALSLKPCRYFLNPGPNAALDSCGRKVEDGVEYDGQLWVALNNMQPNWPIPTGLPSECPKLYTGTVELGIARCAAVINDNGQPPPVDAITANAEQQIIDRWELFQAISCCWSVEGKDWLINQWVVREVSGGCTLGTWHLRLRIGGCTCQEPHS